MIDRYTKAVLTLIAIALVYLCVVLTPLPGVQAQTAQTRVRPGDPTGPAEMVIVGWRGAPGETIPVSSPRTIPVTVTEPVRITGRVVTERADDRAERVVLAGWEENASRDFAAPGPMRTISLKTPGLPVVQK